MQQRRCRGGGTKPSTRSGEERERRGSLDRNFFFRVSRSTRRPKASIKISSTTRTGSRFVILRPSSMGFASCPQEGICILKLFLSVIYLKQRCLTIFDFHEGELLDPLFPGRTILLH